MTAGRWNALAPAALAAVRESDPDRAVLVGSVRMNDIAALSRLELPDDYELGSDRWRRPLLNALLDR